MIVQEVARQAGVDLALGTGSERTMLTSIWTTFSIPSLVKVGSVWGSENVWNHLMSSWLSGGGDHGFNTDFKFSFGDEEIQFNSFFDGLRAKSKGKSKSMSGETCMRVFEDSGFYRTESGSSFFDMDLDLGSFFVSTGFYQLATLPLYPIYISVHRTAAKKASRTRQLEL
jgi:hypothetical protein